MYIDIIERGDTYMGIGKRIKEARENNGLTQNELAELIGVTGSAITNYEKETSHPKEPIMYKLIEALKVDANYLFQDVVKLQETQNNITPREYEHIKKYRSLDAYGQETINIALDREVSRVQQISNAYKEGHSAIGFPTYFMTYYHNLASAGNGEYIFEDLPTDTIEVPVNEFSESADFVIGVNGDSMEPTFYDGDKVYVEKMQMVEIGDIGIFMVNNECFIKEAGKDGLISHNPAYDMISGNENIQCIGKVLGKVEEDMIKA